MACRDCPRARIAGVGARILDLSCSIGEKVGFWTAVLSTQSSLVEEYPHPCLGG
jgi:hypothetical protein